MAAPPRPRFFTPREVAAHARPGDLWVSCLGRVLDLTALVREHHGEPCLRPLLEAAGTDISHWFDPQTHDLLQRVEPRSGLRVPGGGRGPGVPPPTPRSDWVPPRGPPWWRDPRYEVGRLGPPRRLRLLNALTGQQHLLEVCAEETLAEVLGRSLPLNAHAGSYSWRRPGAPAALEPGGRPLQPGGGPGGPDLDLDADLDPPPQPPALLLHFNDDFTEL
ncbi:cytochrome b5 domain-containing protein 1 [Dromaius novaehollandiae]|uniref:cytochrome b5 domain-containing protein 1 n=1 Tax=Dromaius novaehollandiae TaxID=8790 RepID=UPI00312001A6